MFNYKEVVPMNHIHSSGQQVETVKVAWRRGAMIAVAAVAVIALAGCSSKGADAGGGTDEAGIKTGPGVSDTTITLGALTDLSGPFAVVGSALTQGEQLYFDQLNADGGVCGRTIELDVKDHGYDVQKAVGLYTDLAPGVLSMVQMLGSSITAALAQNVDTDNILTIPFSWASTGLASPHDLMAGTSYDVDMVNGVSWLADSQGLVAGDKVGHIYIEGEFGTNAHLGVQYATDQLDLELVSSQVTASTTDLSSQVADLKNQGVKAIIASVVPGQMASVASVVESSGLNVPILGNSISFVPQLLDTSAKASLEKNLYIAQSWDTYSGESDGAATVREAYAEKYTDVPNAFVTVGYGGAQTFGAVLQKACDNGDLTREGLATAFTETTSVDTGNLLPDLDYGTPGEPPTRHSLIAKVDSSVDGGLTVVEPLAESKLGGSYPAPAAGN
ncbi:ABC transporter substrate-binding protein [Herbiconiux sp. P17]|uniref:ABC transporter substrate-binding protein n=1 Tax=Herbiconiux wuyangfengii TaxID=3342794 RepID=UPI0035BA950B